MTHPRAPRNRHRRAFAVASVVVLLMMLNILAFGAMDGSRDDGGIAALRVETLRSLYAAESGVTLAIGEMSAGRDAPAPGTRTEVGHASIHFQSADQPEQIFVEGRAGFGRRRIIVETTGSD